MTFPRGVQTSDRRGVVELRTLYPGCIYQSGGSAGLVTLHHGPTHGLVATIVVGVNPDTTP